MAQQKPDAAIAAHDRPHPRNLVFQASSYLGAAHDRPPPVRELERAERIVSFRLNSHCNAGGNREKARPGMGGVARLHGDVEV
jgi:hypothetical protein